MSEPAGERISPSGPEPSLARRVLPFLLAVGLVAFVLGRLDLPSLLTALRSTSYVGFLAFTLAFNMALLAADALATTHVYRRTVCPVAYRELVVIRGASYLPSLLNHHIGQGWLTYFISRVYGAPLWRVAGATLLVYATTFGSLVLLEIIALPMNQDRLVWLAPTVGVIAAAGFAYLVVVHLRPDFLKRRQATAPLVEVGVRGHLLALLYRAPHVAVLFVGTWAPYRFFGVDVPLADALVVIPPLMFVAALPITPQGVGTRDLFAQQLLFSFAAGSPKERAAAIAAASLSWAGALTLVQLAFTPLFMQRAYRLLARADKNRSQGSPVGEPAPPR